jgi:type IV secretory pathway VirB10-like protein
VLPSIEQTEPARTVIVPRVESPAARGPLRLLLTWVAFGVVAVVVVVGTTLWSVTLRSAASRAAPEPAGIDTAGAQAAASLVALPTTPAAPATTAAAVRSPAPRPRVVAPPPPAPVPHSVPALPLTDPASSIRPDPVGCAEPLCAESSALPSSSLRNAAAATKVTAAED